MKFVVCLALVALVAETYAQTQDPDCPAGLADHYYASKQECLKDCKTDFDGYQNADENGKKEIIEKFITCIQAKMGTNEGFKNISDECLKEVKDGATEEEAKQQQRDCLQTELKQLCPKLFS